MPQRNGNNNSSSSSPDPAAASSRRRGAVDSFDATKPFVLHPKHLCWLALLTLIMPYTEQYSTLFLQRLMEVLFRETLDVHPLSWKDMVAQASVIPCGRYKEGTELNMNALMHKFAQKLKDPIEMRKFMMEDTAKAVSATIAQPGEGIAVLRRSWFGVHMRKIRLAYLKLSDVAIQRLLRAFSSWVDGESMEDYDFGTEVVGMPGYMLISTTGDHANPSTTDAYEQ
ncbi:hypothetical protein FRC18_007081 [Serendipita sp. 400]|nr:hypothetical protein FRC18_007081 [Serendipita sp. 400]